MTRRMDLGVQWGHGLFGPVMVLRSSALVGGIRRTAP